jgi:hypothetical protein
MHLSDHSLQQLDEAYLERLDEAALRGLSARLLADLKEARERLQQGPHNSSRPPSSRMPWERGSRDEPEADETPDPDPQGTAEPTADPDGDHAATRSPPTTAPKPPKTAGAGKPGKPPGAPGFGRTQQLVAHDTRAHHPACCDGCGAALSAADARAYTGFQSVDLVWGNPDCPGLHLEIIDHRYFEATCGCGLRTRASPGTHRVETLDEPVNLSEWRLVGPGLATLIVALHLRYRLSYRRIREWLHDWLGLHLSTGTLSQTVQEAGAALAPAEEVLVADLRAGDALVHADETSWRQQPHLLWLWVFASTTVTLYYIAGRGKELIENLLPGFSGWLMSDGWNAYRHLPNRLRCWAHLIRKAQALIDSFDREAKAFGHLVQGVFDTLIASIAEARAGPLGAADLPTAHAERLAALRRACEDHVGHRHAKTHALATELLNDWEAIFTVLDHPSFPLTNNHAERTLRHWVIARRIMLGTRSDTGSRVFALLASVIDTCRQRGHVPWRYMADAIAARRAGRDLPPFPQPVGV